MASPLSHAAEKNRDERSTGSDPQRALAELADDASAGQIENVRVGVLGRAGELTAIMRGMRDVPPDERPAIGQLVNEIKRELEGPDRGAAGARQKRAAMQRALAGERLDVTLPGTRIARGRLHPLTQVAEQMIGLFEAMGFEAVATQDVEDDFHNFSALNFPPDHPAREMQDTFFLPGGIAAAHPHVQRPNPRDAASPAARWP